MILCDTIDDTDKFLDLIIVECDLHTLSTEYIGRSYQYRIAETVCNFFCLLCGKYSSTCSSRNLCFFQNLIEKLTVLCRIDILCFCSKDLNTHLHQALG